MLMGHYRLMSCMIAGITSVSATAMAQGPGFHGLGFVEGIAPASAAIAISYDGAAIVGWCDNDAVRWFGDGVQTLGRLPSPYQGIAVAYAVSGDGSTVVGLGRSIAVGTPYWAFVWTKDQGMTPLCPPPEEGAFFGSYAVGISADGRTIVGASDTETGYPRAFALGPAREWTPITLEPSTASAVSADGSTVVGVINLKGIDTAFAWSEQTGLVPLGDLPGGDSGGIAYAVNANGRVIVGGSSSARSNPSYAYEAFRWTAETGMVPLGELPGGESSSEARGVSADGSVVVGVSSVHPFPRTAAFIWDAQRGIRDLRDVLINDYGLDLTGWELTSAQSIAANGRIIVGRGVNPQGQLEGWVAHLQRRCRADWNDDGAVTFADFSAFLDAFLCAGDDSGCAGADFNEDGVENSSDFFEFVAAFLGFCA